MTIDTDRAARLRAAREARGFASASSAASRLNVKLSTYIHHENGTRNFSAEDAQSYARAFGVTFSHLYFGTKVAQPDTTSGVMVVGEVSIGIWRDAATVSVQAGIMIDAPASDAARLAYKITDSSADLAFQPGDVAIVSPEDKALKDGDLVVVLRQRSSLTETSIRRVADNGTRLALHSRSRNAKDDLVYPAPSRAHETVSIVGKVVARYSPL
jgi:transcriptional regulator with XRE-family HTH domain